MNSCWWQLSRSLRRRIRRRAPLRIHQHVVSPFMDRLAERAMDGQHCQYIRVTIGGER